MLCQRLIEYNLIIDWVKSILVLTNNRHYIEVINPLQHPPPLPPTSQMFLTPSFIQSNMLVGYLETPSKGIIN